MAGIQQAPIRQIAAHGGTLINRVLEGSARDAAIEAAKGLKNITLNEYEASDVELIAVGAVSPLTGFMTKEQYDGVVDKMHLPGDLPWTIPITATVSTDVASTIKEGEKVAISGPDGTLLAILTVESKFALNKDHEAENVYTTTETAHPGVAALHLKGDVALGGPIDVINVPAHDDFLPYRLTPAQTRAEFLSRGWRRIVGFQTRNPIHRAHEYLLKVAMEMTDGLLLHPLVGKTKDDDVSPELRMECYEALVDNYFAKGRVLTSVYPAAMRYAGPREAIFHALIRKNYGCTHFIVGRDHAGVGKYYGSFDAQYIFDYFDPRAIDITPLFFDYTFFCKRVGGMASIKTTPGDESERIALSGTKVREMLRAGEIPPEEFTRPEVAKILIKGMQG